MDAIQLDLEGHSHTQIRLECGQEPRVTALVGFELAERPVDPAFARRLCDRVTVAALATGPAVIQGDGPRRLTVWSGAGVAIRCWAPPGPAEWAGLIQAAAELAGLAGVDLV